MSEERYPILSAIAVRAIAAAALASALCAPAAPRPATPSAERLDWSVWWCPPGAWKARVDLKLDEIRKGPGRYDIVFVGDSITQNWEGWCEKNDIVKVARLYSDGKLAYPNGPGRAVWDEMRRRHRLLNIAMAGDTTQHALWRLQNGELEGYVAKGVVLMPDWANEDPPEDVAAGVKAILERIAEYQPQAITLLMPILPCGEQKDDPRRLRIERINALIKPFADGRRVVWFDICAHFLDQDGNVRRDLMPDFQHPLGKGYGVWRDALLPYFKSICKR